MGFTIGGMRDIRELRRIPRLPKRPARTPDLDAVAEYTGLWGWDVVPGTRARPSAEGQPPECSCGDPGCPSPGAHPLDPGAVIRAGTPLEAVTRAWHRTPGASILLPTGRAFDAIEVPSAAGRRAVLRLERMGLPLGPVAAGPHGRTWFLVAPGAAAALPDLLYRTGWDDTALDLRGLGPGGHITAPPSDHGGLGPVGWLSPPSLETAADPPQARLLLGTLAYCCRARAES
ncbi:bifunctional DNA primase/polymerase [Streptomyces sodiiphilus]|uniref:Bifunctional DNA primase/polymerase n=1 Tax=Streptomyces sodiiphilus TaxID=226217 RepID=A0ABN2NRC2_9ACTN